MKIVNQEVSVVAHFNTKGVPRPYRFITVDEFGDSIEVKGISVSRMYELTVEKKRVFVYTCSAIISNIKRYFELRFQPFNCSWILYKI